MHGYRSFQDLAAQERTPDDFCIRCRQGASHITVMAPHGGRIEPGTSEAARAIAGPEHGFYAFEGVKLRGNWALHITSSHFNEPAALELAARADAVVTLHGCQGKEPLVYLGGLNGKLLRALYEELVRAGFRVGRSPNPGLGGTNPDNLCNRGRLSMGVQMELTRALRERMFEDLSPAGRMEPTTVFHHFVAAVRKALADYNLELATARATHAVRSHRSRCAAAPPAGCTDDPLES